MEPCKEEARVVTNHTLGRKSMCVHAPTQMCPLTNSNSKKRGNNGQYTHEKILDINSHLEIENKNHNEISLLTD